MMLIKRFFALALLSCFLAACGMFDFKADKSMVIGAWKAEKFDFEGLKIPLAPKIEITQNALLLVSQSSRESMPLESIEVKDDAVTLNMQGIPIGLTFHFESKEKMYFKVPVLGTKIYFTRS